MVRDPFDGAVSAGDAVNCCLVQRAVFNGHGGISSSACWAGIFGPAITTVAAEQARNTTDAARDANETGRRRILRRTFMEGSGGFTVAAPSFYFGVLFYFWYSLIFFLIKWFQAHERTIVYCFWGVFALGLTIAFSLANDEILKNLK